MQSLKLFMARAMANVRKLEAHSTTLSLLAALLFGLLVSGAAAQETATSASPIPPLADSVVQTRGYEFSFPAMGTQVELKAFHHDEALVRIGFELVQQRVAELEAILTDYNPKSETRQLTAAAQGGFTSVSDPLWQVLHASDHWHKLGEGAFDASLGQLTQLWRKYRPTKRLPTTDEIEQARQRTGWRHVQLNPDKQQIRFSIDDLRLDFGAIGKGFIVDRAFELLQTHGLDCSLVNVSGNMRAGEPPPERPGWRIEIAPLERGGQPLRRIYLKQASIATSGDLWQFVLIDGVRRSHILDPRTGIGVAGPVCATAISPTATDADALATTACILGFERAQLIAATLEDTELLVATKIGSVVAHASEGALANDVHSADPINPTLQVHHTVGFPGAL